MNEWLIEELGRRIEALTPRKRSEVLLLVCRAILETVPPVSVAGMRGRKTLRVTVRFGDNIVVIQEGDRPPVSVGGEKGLLLTLALLKDAEGNPLPEVWGLVVCSRSTTPRRLAGLSNELKDTVETAAPLLKLRLVKTKHAQHSRPGSDVPCFGHYEVAFSRDIDFECQPRDSASACQDAATLYHSKRIPEAFLKAAEAAGICHLYFSSYEIAAWCIKEDANLAKTSGYEAAAKALFAGVVAIEAWLDALRRRVDLGRMDARFQNLVTGVCLAEIEARLKKLAELKTLLRGKDHGTDRFKENLVNLLVRHLTNAKTSTSSNVDHNCFTPDAVAEMNEWFGEAIDRVEDNPRYDDYIDRIGASRSERLLTTKQMMEALSDLSSHNRCARFPEPGDDEDWKERTIDQLSKVLLDWLLRPQSYSKDLPLDEDKARDNSQEEGH